MTTRSVLLALSAISFINFAPLPGANGTSNYLDSHTNSSRVIARPRAEAPTTASEAPARSLSAGEVEKLNRQVAEQVARYKTRQNTMIASGELNAQTFRPASGLDGLPANLNGTFPIQIPTYDGVEQLLPINNRWMIVATSNLDEVSAEIGRLVKADPAWASYDFLAAQQKWLDGIAADKPDWVLRKAQIDAPVAKYAGKARQNIGELNMANTNYYTITSPDDPAYKSPQIPTRVARFMASMGDEVYPGFNPNYALYSYVEMPAPLVDGKTYTITLQNGKSVTFTYDELTLVSRAIKVNQVGYINDAKKYAYAGAFLQDIGPLDLSQHTFSVVNVSNGQAVFSGPVTLRSANPRFAPATGQDANTRPFVSGENIYEMDFSALTTGGTYFITIPGVGRSWPFAIDKNVYSQAFYTAIRGMFHQRCGIELKLPYTPWKRVKCHSTPVYECQNIPFYFEPLLNPPNWAVFDVVGGTMDKTKVTADATGGWHDAGDWDKNIRHYANALDMLALMDMKPTLFADRQLNLPESGDGIPDILNEVEYGLLVWKKSMNTKGGVSGFLETSTHPELDDPKFPFAFALRTRWSSLLFSAAASWYAHLVKPFNSSKSTEWQDLAIKAYNFGMDPKNSLGTLNIPAKTNRGTGTPYTITFTENDFFNKPFAAAAKLRLFILTGDKAYVDGVEQLLADIAKGTTYNGTKIILTPGSWPFSIRDSSLSLFLCVQHPDVATVLKPETISTWKNYYIKLADTYAALNDKEFYRRSRNLYDDAKMAWGTDVMTNHAKALLFAHYFTQDNKYKQAALYNIDYMLGANATGMSWTTGIGYSYPVPIHHRVSEDDGIFDPVPGIAIYGPTDNNLTPFDTMWLPKDPAGKPIQFLKASQYTNGLVVLPRLRNWVPHPTLRVEQNEFTIWETMSSGIFAYGYLMNDGWRAPTWVVNRKPRDPRVLFGQWYLP